MRYPFSYRVQNYTKFLNCASLGLNAKGFLMFFRDANSLKINDITTTHGDITEIL